VRQVVEIDHAVDGSMLPHFLVKVELHKPRPAGIHRPDTADSASATALRRPGCRCRAGWASVGRRAMTMGVETTDRRRYLSVSMADVKRQQRSVK